MLPVIVLIGQKNVGKSTLFNKLTHTRDALTSNCPGLTRDRQYGYFQCKQFKSILIDTGGIDGFYNLKMKNMQHYIAYQTNLAVKEADIVLFVINGHFGENSIDYNIVNFLRKLEKKIFIIVNKIDNISYYIYNPKWDYYSYGIKNIICVSAIHGYGIDDLLEKLSLLISKDIFRYKDNVSIINIGTTVFQRQINSLSNDKVNTNIITLAVVGPQNSGKSTFINHLLGSDRMITCDIPGTTRNSIRVIMTYNDQQYMLIDTAGVRKTRRINSTTEQISILETLKIVKYAPILLFIGDVKLGISDRDLYLLRFITENSKALVIAMNKWDKIPVSSRNKIKKILYDKINFINFFQIHFISALYGNGIRALFQSIKETHFCSIKTVNTAHLIRILYAAITKYPPPLLYGRRIKLKYVHIGGYNPFTLIIHGTHVSKLPNDYRRYLKKYFYHMLNMTGVLLHMQFKDTINPFIK